MSNKVSFFLPVRKGSQRVEYKNTREFAGIKGGLIALKLTQLLNCRKVAEIILSTNDEISMEIATQIDPEQRKIKIVRRPEELCLSTTALKDLISYVPTITDAEHILWGHTTTPFVDANDYDKIIESYLFKINEGFDSLIAVSEHQNFLLNAKGEIINYDHNEGNWPRTQDLTKLFEVNHAAFLTSRQNYIQNNDRIGKKPYLFVQDKIKSFDIDWEDDFLIAEGIYERISKR